MPRRVIMSIIFCLLIGACDKGEESLVMEPLSFQDIADWEMLATDDALLAFRRACQRPAKATLRAWTQQVSGHTLQSICEAARYASSPTEFFARHFTPWRITTTHKADGILTGYYTPTLRGSTVASARYHVPIYAPPPANIRSRYSRAEIEAGALKGRAQVVMWLDDKVAAFFLHIQGSGLVTLPDGSLKKLVYAGKNGFPYTAIGRQFINDGTVAREDMSMQWLTTWLERHPHRADKVMNSNASYVFFALEDAGDGMKGAHATPLTPMHAIAIDPRYVSYGLPIVVQSREAGVSRLAMTQDTGGAIKGPIRADLYTGVGERAATLAGHLKHPLRFIALLPREDAH